MKFFNLNIDKVYCINLLERPDRKAHVQKEFDKIGLEVEFFEGIIEPEGNEFLTAGMIGCFKSHRNIYIKAFEAGHENILIFEDDIQFIEGSNWLLDKATSQIPVDAEFLFFGFVQDNGLMGFTHKQNDYWVVPSTGWGCHAYAILGRNTLKRIISGTANLIQEIDRQLSNLVLPAYDVKTYMMLPNAINQIDLGTNVQTHRKND